MGPVRLYAISIDEVRDVFRAGGETAATLRAVAARRFADTRPAAPGLLGKLGPVFRRQADAPVVRPGVPNGTDVDLLLYGRYVPPHRLTACWALLEAWLETLAWGVLTEELDEGGLDGFDFDLVRAEVPARLGLRQALRAGLGVALMPSPGLAAGWVGHQHALAMAAAWRAALGSLEPGSRGLAERVVTWLGNYPEWADAAAAAHRPAPDLVAVLHA